MFVLKLSMGIGMTFYPGIGVSKKRKESSCILLLSVLAFFWYLYWQSFGIKIGIGIELFPIMVFVQVSVLVFGYQLNTFDMIKKNTKNLNWPCP